jgi:hypothetical protein
MSHSPQFKFLVEYQSQHGLMTARFTNDKHARNFVKSSKKDGNTKVKLFSLTNDGMKDKEIKLK